MYNMLYYKKGGCFIAWIFRFRFSNVHFISHIALINITRQNAHFHFPNQSVLEKSDFTTVCSR